MPLWPNSGVFVFPITIAPASSSARTYEMEFSGTKFASARQPNVFGTPAL